MRATAVASTILGLLTAACGLDSNQNHDDRCPGGKCDSGEFSVVEASIPDLQRALALGQVTSRQLVEAYLERIHRLNPQLHAAIVTSPDALAEAERLDQERARGDVRGPLHGIPISVKDLFHTLNMPTTGGMKAFEGFIPPYESTVVRKLREAGAIIIAKANLSELAGQVDQNMPMGFSHTGGQTMNPYGADLDPSGSSSGSGAGTATSLWAASIGTETNGSIVSVCTKQMVVGIRPTPGLASRYGVMPLMEEWDSPGPLARTVTDAAIMLGAIDGPDSNDPRSQTAPAEVDYTRFLHADGLSGKRIGVPRGYFSKENLKEPGQWELMQEAIELLRMAGATVIPIDLPVLGGNLEDPWPLCWNANFTEEGVACSITMNYAIKRDLNKYFASLGESSEIDNLDDLIAFYKSNPDSLPEGVATSYLDAPSALDLVADHDAYLAHQAKDIAIAKTNGLEKAINDHKLAAVFFPSEAPWDIASRAGFPSVSVPFGVIADTPAPMGIAFTGPAFSEAALIELAYSFEQATHRVERGRIAPPAFR